MKPKFKRAVENGDIVSSRLYLANELLLDPRGYSFQEMLNFAETIFAEKLYEPDNGKSYSQSQSDWTEDFLFSIKNDLDNNFSKERLIIFATIVKVVLKEKATFLEEESKRQKEQQDFQERERQRYNNRIEKKTVYGGMTIGGIALTTAGLYASKVALTSLGVAGIIVGGVLFYKELLK